MSWQPRPPRPAHPPPPPQHQQQWYNNQQQQPQYPHNYYQQQQNAFNHNTDPPGYPQQQFSSPNYPPASMPQFFNPNPPDDSDPWNWGWDESSKSSASNANVLGDSFTNSGDTWSFPRSTEANSSHPERLESAQLVRNATEAAPPKETQDADPPRVVLNRPPSANNALEEFINRELVDNVSTLTVEAAEPPRSVPPPTTAPPPLMTIPGSSGANPFKRIGQVSHRSVPAQAAPILQDPPAQLDAFANLETTPDNSERLDNNSPAVVYQPTPFLIHQPSENSESAAPSNDRNEYLQTGHLSENNSFDRRSPQYHPPPGFRRMVLGQPESEFNRSDEPPPGLSRMVPGHTTEPPSLYNQSADDYLDRQIDGQTTESDSLTNSACMPRPVYRQVDGQPTDDDETPINYNQMPRGSIDRRPIGFDRMIPGGETNAFNTFQNQSFNDVSRVITGFEQIGSSEPREQNMDGSDYSEVDQNQNQNRNRSTEDNLTPDTSDTRREGTMEGENLQDQVRDQNVDGAQDPPLQQVINRTIDLLIDSDQDRNPSQQQQQLPQEKDPRKYRDDTTGDESERDRLYKMNPKKDKDNRHRSSRDRDIRYGGERRTDKDRRTEYNRDDKRYKPGKDSRYDTEDTDYYSDRDRRRYREGSYPSGKPPRPEERPLRRDDDNRRSYDRSSRDDQDRRRRDNRDKDNRRYNNYDSDRENRRREKEREYEDRDTDRSKRYTTSDRDRHYSSLRKERSGRDDRKRDVRDPRYRPPRPSSRDPEPAEDEYDDMTDRDRRDPRDRDEDRDRRSRYRRDQRDKYYDRYGYGMDPYSQQIYQQHQTYQYYENLRLTNPQAYLEIYNKYMAGGGHLSQNDINRAMAGYSEASAGYNSMPAYDTQSATRLGDDRGSVHSGRSSTNGELIKERMVLDGSGGGYFYPYRRLDNSLNYSGKQQHQQDITPTRVPRMEHGSIRTDYSGSRDFNTDASLNLYLEDSTIKSDRNTPLKFGTAHIKGVISSPNMVIVIPSYPSDGQPAVVEILNINKLLRNDPICAALTAYPGPLIKGTTHKKSVIEFCESKIRAAVEKATSPLTQERSFYSHHGNSSYSERPPSLTSELGSLVLMWELLVLLLRQNGLVVGTDIAELLIKNKNQYTWRGAPQQHQQQPPAGRVHSRRDSASSATSRSADIPLEDGHDQIGDGDRDSCNDIPADQSTLKKDRKPSKDNSKRKTSLLENNEKYITDKFREYLLFGNGKDALEWAMSHGLWGHALFLASKLDRRTYANVMTRFANGLLPNDPLQTLYQLMSGRQPAAATCVLDEKWGDWRPHLAMILSNTSQRPDLDKKSITILGDTLNSRGDLFAAQFCYLMARIEFGKRPVKLQSSTSGPLPRLVLLGTSPSTENFAQFASNDAIMMTEIYEYACSLADDNFNLIDFQFYKYLFATRLMDYGLYDRALFYMEKIAQVITKNPTNYEVSFIDNVLEIADRLKHFDPEEHVSEICDGEPEYAGGSYELTKSESPTEQAWISNLRKTLDELNTGNIKYEHPEHHNHNQYEHPQNSWTQPYQSDQIQQQLQQQTNDFQNLQQQQQQQHPETVDPLPQIYDPGYSQSNAQYYGHESVPYHEQEVTTPEVQLKDESLDYKSHLTTDSGYWNQDYQQHQQHSYGYNEPLEPAEGKTSPTTTEDALVDQQRPQISMPNMSRSMYDESQDNKPPSATYQQQQQQPPSKGPSKVEKKSESANKTAQSGGGGWFGGIFNKLSLKPKNQMILPDDKNPTIVWDPEKKRWMNTEADEDEQESQLGPPPKIPITSIPAMNQNHLPTPQQQSDSTLPPPASTGNIFKLQKGRHIKKSYVDVFNPSGAPMRPLPPAQEVLGAPIGAAPTSYFVPNADTSNISQTTGPSFFNPADYAS